MTPARPFLHSPKEQPGQRTHPTVVKTPHGEGVLLKIDPPQPWCSLGSREVVVAQGSAHPPTSIPWHSDAPRAQPWAPQARLTQLMTILRCVRKIGFL